MSERVEASVAEGENTIEERHIGAMWELEQKLDQSMDEEANKLKIMYREKGLSMWMLLRLSFQSLGIVYGDLGTSPLYVFYNTFPDGIKDSEDVIGALSLIIYSLLLIPLIKYVFIVCKANDNGQGGTLAIYSLLCRHAKVKLIPNQQRSDEDLTTYSRTLVAEGSFAAKTKKWLESKESRKRALLFVVLLGTCMMIGDGILTPAISVLSATGGIKVSSPKMSSDIVVVMSIVILVGLFSMQHYGTDKVGWLFAPIVFIWFLFIGATGIYNIFKHDTRVLKAFSPTYVYLYFKRRGRDGWISLGGILLSITGTEALYADIAYFPLLAIQLAFTFFVFPCLLLSYCGQAAYLVNHKDHYDDAFYASIPRSVYWPMFVVATGAAIVGSQAAVSGTYSIIKQAVSHGCFPRVKIVHTSKKFVGQIYCPDINWMLMLGCIAVTASFKNQSQIGNAYGTAVVLVMLVTTLLMVLTMLLVWRCHWILVLIFAFLSLVVELSYFSAVLLKVNQGGWVPLIIAAISLLVMSVWQYATVKKYEFEMHSKVSMSWILGLGPSLGLVRVPGVGLVYTELASGVPHIFSHFITNLPAIHSVVVFVCVKYLPVYTVPEEERFLVKRIGPKKFRMFRCVARYGYKDLHRKDDGFENKLLTNLSSFIRIETMMEPALTSSTYSSAFSVNYTQESRDELLRNNSNHNNNNNNNNMDIFSSMVDYTVSTLDTIVPADSPRNATSFSQNNTVEEEEEEEDELEFLKTCKESGVVHIMGNTVVKARNGSWLPKRIAIDYVYAFLDKICRENSVILHVPHETLLNVGHVFYI
ncbi:PREDICTED: potassium transporter 9-like isoform X2 [Brassica oleracea var. oleracea]|uniref:potassium transporter 9-like isoform X1 n=1 Tax=Brassica oleracea var. oleracea TaxID=109376 RepID=UPI0006A6F6AD|nr:PREDICTED: potassium transporter 9-like isoform X1 [Brassica oleracea var. oleracea]XP_013597663.1 PREDICTED: potassium transporter 9-like isoform X2 [Brassica oleracea var. oleracea]